MITVKKSPEVITSILILAIISILFLITLTSTAVAMSDEWKTWKDEDQPSEYYSEEIKIRVVDADTGDPIENAKVVAQWILESPFGGSNGVSVGIVETSTDKNGWFYIPARGSIKRLRFTMFKQKDPVLTISQSEYRTVSLINANKEYLTKHGVTIRKEESHRITVKTLQFADIDTDILRDGINQDYSEEIIPSGSTRRCIWHTKTIKLQHVEKK